MDSQPPLEPYHRSDDSVETAIVVDPYNYYDKITARKTNFIKSPPGLYFKKINRNKLRSAYPLKTIMNIATWEVRI